MDEDYDYGEYYPDNGEMEEENVDDNVIELENMFYEAEDRIRDDPTGALELFDQIIAREEQLTPEERKQSFQSLKSSILIRSKLKGQLATIQSHLGKLLGLFKYQFRNDGNEALNQILEGLLKLNEEGVAQIFNEFIESLRSLQLSQLFINANIKLARVYVDRRDPVHLAAAIKNIADSVESVTDTDRKNNLLVELYAYQIGYCNITQRVAEIKPIYRKLTKLNMNVHDPRISATINETVGKMKLIERRWDLARKSLMDAFYSYQDVGDQQAKQVLMYAVLASILENFQLNIFDDLRTRVYEADDGIQAMKQIRQAYDHKDISMFNRVKQRVTGDPFMNDFLGELHKVISFSKILSLVGCYRNLKIEYVARILAIDSNLALKYLQELILTGQIKGSINQPQGYVALAAPVNGHFQIISELIDQL